MTGTSSEAADYILKSFNALDPVIAANPMRTLDHLFDYRMADVAGHIAPASGSGDCTSGQTIGTNLEESYKKIAESAGISGSYGVYSGSAQFRATQEVWQSAYSYSLAYVGQLHWGSVSLDTPKDFAAIKKLLKPDLVTALNAIASSDQAEAFVRTYGTHVITGVDLGGRFAVMNTATATSRTTYDTMEASVNASYGAVNSLSAAVAASRAAFEANKQYNYAFHVSTVGGDPRLAAQIRGGDFASVDRWTESCRAGMVSGINGTVEIWQLADSKPGMILRDYVRWSLLINSLNAPSLFTETVRMGGHFATCNVTVPSGFKVIGGGAAVTPNSSCFLTGMYPGNGPNPTTWTAEAHDAVHDAGEGDELASYCLAIHDPDDLLTVSVTEAHTNLVQWHVRCSADQGPGLTLGGGIRIILRGGFPRFVTASRPTDAGWLGESTDYHDVSTSGTQHVYRIAVDLAGHPVTARKPALQPQVGGAQSVSNVTARTSGPLTGGGVELTDNDGPGNLVQQSFPSAQNAWTEFNKDQDHASNAVANVYAYRVEFARSRSS